MERITLTPEEAIAARDWIADCYWEDLEPEDIAELTDKQLAYVDIECYWLSETDEEPSDPDA